MASHMEWYLPEQEEADWIRLFQNKYHKESYMNAFNKPCSFLSHTSKLGNAHPNTDCLAASNGVCTKINMARFGLLLVEKEVNNNSQT